MFRKGPKTTGQTILFPPITESVCGIPHTLVCISYIISDYLDKMNQYFKIVIVPVLHIRK